MGSRVPSGLFKSLKPSVWPEQWPVLLEQTAKKKKNKNPSILRAERLTSQPSDEEKTRFIFVLFLLLFLDKVS